MKRLRQYLIDLSDGASEPEVQAWLKKFSLKTFQKGSILLEGGEICRNYYFVEEGAIRIFTYHQNREITVWITGEGSFFTHLDSFNHNKPSDCAIEAIENSAIYLINKDAFDNLMAHSPQWPKFMLRVWQEAFISITRAVVAFQGTSANERYDNLQSQTDYTVRFKQKFLASFLGVTPTSLSRLRKKG